MIRSVCAWIAVVGIGAPLWAKDINPDPKSLDIPAEGLGAFSPNPSKSTPKNAFVPLAVLQRSLSQPERVNAFLVQAKGELVSESPLNEALRRHVRLEDFVGLWSHGAAPRIASTMPRDQTVVVTAPATIAVR